ncbi:LPXTG cell wall anchor domain-containing protein [Streptomyces ardesiacus]|uniref:LPXTG cell wall anchor domain-containing protein n=1 Tax=Streptomyces ardesiacus TaxID=285564 RepID=UPI00363747D4
MKLRRALAAAAVTAVVAPAALLAAPSAHAADDASASPSVSPSSSAPSPGTDGADETDEPANGTTTDPAPGDTTSSPTDSPSATEGTDEEEPPAPDGTEPTTSAPADPAPATTAPEAPETTGSPEESESPDPEPSVCEDTKVDVDIEGLPGEIAAGSGWHEFSLTVANNSGSTLENLEYLAGASADVDGEELFESEKVALQAWNPEAESWQDLSELGYAVGYIGYTDELAPDYEVEIPMRIDVRAGAPVGAGFTLGATIYGDADGACTGFGDVAYEFRIVAPGTDTEGTRPQEGGKAPVAPVDVREKPAAGVPQVTGSLASTGSSSALPVIGLAGGLAVLVGGGAVFVVRRRRAGSDA